MTQKNSTNLQKYGAAIRRRVYFAIYGINIFIPNTPPVPLYHQLLNTKDKKLRSFFSSQFNFFHHAFYETCDTENQ